MSIDQLIEYHVKKKKEGVTFSSVTVRTIPSRGDDDTVRMINAHEAHWASEKATACAYYKCFMCDISFAPNSLVAHMSRPHLSACQRANCKHTFTNDDLRKEHERTCSV